MKNIPLLYVPVKLHVKQYFEKEFGGAPVVINKDTIIPIRMHSNTLLGQMVMLCTDKVPFRFAPKRAADRKQMLALQLPARMKHFTMSDDQREKLTTLLEKLFNDKVYDFIRSQAAVTGSEWGALRCFAQIHELDTLSFDPDKFYKLWRDRKNSITHDNREAIENWYRTNKVQPDMEQAWNQSNEAA